MFKNFFSKNKIYKKIKKHFFCSVIIDATRSIRPMHKIGAHVHKVSNIISNLRKKAECS